MIDGQVLEEDERPFTHGFGYRWTAECAEQRAVLSVLAESCTVEHLSPAVSRKR